MAWIEILDSELDAESELRDGTPSLLKKLRDNALAIQAGLTGAPKYENAAFQDNTLDSAKFLLGSLSGLKFIDNSIPQSKIAAAACTQATAKTTVFSLVSATNITALNGAGLYMLGYSHAWTGNVARGGSDRYEFSFGGGRGVLALSNFAPGQTFMDMNVITGTNVPTVQIDVRYFDASPPYNLGNGDIPIFVFAKVGSNGVTKAMWISKNPPWAYNGPTEIKAHFKRDGKPHRYRRRVPFSKDEALSSPEKMEAFLDAIADPANIEEYEVTQEVKNADMPLIPHGFVDIASDESIVMLDPVSPFTEQLATIHDNSDHFREVIAGEYIKFGNHPIRGAIAPPGVIPVRAWLE